MRLLHVHIVAKQPGNMDTGHKQANKTDLPASDVITHPIHENSNMFLWHARMLTMC